MGFPLPSAFPPSMGTTGPVMVAGAGLVCGIAGGQPAHPGWLAAHRGQHRAGRRPGHRQQADHDGDQAPWPGRPSRDWHAHASPKKAYGVRERVHRPNISPETPYRARPTAGARARRRAGSGVRRAGERLPELLRGGDRGLAGELAADVRGGRSVDQPAPGEQRYAVAVRLLVPSPRASTAPGGAACSAVWCSARVRSSSGRPTTAISAGPASQASATARPAPAARGYRAAMPGSTASAASAASRCRAEPASAE